MKKLVFTVTNDITYDQRMERICTTLSNNNYDVTIIGFYKKRSVKSEIKPYKQIRLSVFFKKGKLFYLEYNFRLFWFLIFKKYDIYCSIDLDTLLPVFINSRLKRKPCVYDAHEYYTELPEIVDRPLIKKMWMFLERILLPRIKYNYTVGYSIAETLSKKYKQQYTVIRNVPLLSQNEKVLNKQNFVLYQGTLNKGRGLENLMLAMENIDAQLYIAGEGDLSKELRNFAAQLPHSKKIRFLGYVRPAELKTYTLQAKLGVNFIENIGLSYYFSLSNKFFDYIHAGLPQITMNFPEYKKLNDQYNVALLIDDLDTSTISDSINRLLLDEIVYSTLKKNTLIASKELNWQMEELVLLKFYNDIR